MWFIWLATGLALLVAAGLYARRRLVAAAGALGLGARGRAALRWVWLWLVFGYPVIVFATVAVSLIVGGERMGAPQHPLVTWGLILPWFLSVLVVFQATPYLLVLDLVRRLRRRAVPAAPSMSRRHAAAVLGVLGAFAVYTPARIAWEHGDLRWRHHVVQAPAPAGGAARGAPPPRLRIAFLADLQQDAHTTAADARAIIERLNAQEPDLVLSGGDWINMGPDHVAAAARSAGLARSRLGTFSVRGDHEHFVYVDRARGVAEVTAAMRAEGVEMLHNEVRRFDHHGRTVAVAFLTYSYPARTPDDEIERLIAGVEDADLAILVTHQLDAAIAARARDRVDLILAAHTHGGQVNPVIGLWHAPLARLETPYTDGRYRLGATTIIVTAGVGYSIVPFRYAAPGSVETIDVVW